MADANWPEWAQGWTPPVERETRTVDPHSCAGLAALLDADAGIADVGEPLPALWQWVALVRWPAMSTVGPDGHPTVDTFMPPTPYPRRVWLGTSVEMPAPLLIGEEVDIQRTVTGIEEKTGSTGVFAMVATTTSIRSTTGVGELTETSRVAYRPAAESAATAALPPSPMAVTEGPWLRSSRKGWTARPNPTVLMRYSALTGNGHRIHYDAPYTTQVEGHPGLLVHGPLMATLLAEVVRRENPQRMVASFSCRAQRPYYLGPAATITAEGADSVFDLALRDNGSPADAPPCMTAKVTLR